MIDALDLNRTKESLTNMDKTYDIIFEIIRSKLNTPVSGDILDALHEMIEIDKVGSDEIPESLIAHNLMFNAAAIFEFAESPIEKIFLNALNIISFPFKEVFIQFTHESVDVDEIKPEERMKYRKDIVALWKKYQKISYKNSISKFMDFVKEVTDFTEDQKMSIIFQLLTYYVSKLYGIYYVTLQPTMKNVLVHGRSIRPDIYIWNPYDPAFKVLIECDGYSYHSDKTSFSHDRTRDRILNMKGYKVLRFSGIDIVNTPVKMAKELHQYLVKQKLPVPT